MAKKHTPALTQFATLAAEIVTPALAEAGFKTGEQELTATYCLLPYTHQNRYIILKADAHPGSSYFNFYWAKANRNGQMQSGSRWRCGGCNRQNRKTLRPVNTL